MRRTSAMAPTTVRIKAASPTRLVHLHRPRRKRGPKGPFGSRPFLASGADVLAWRAGFSASDLLASRAGFSADSAVSRADTPKPPAGRGSASDRRTFLG